MNPLFAIDGYKLSHRQQYPEGTSLVYSNLTPRSNKYFKSPVMEDSPVMWVGTQEFVLEWLVKNFNEGFFRRDKEVVIHELKMVIDSYLGKDAVPMDGIEDLHDLGYLPIHIKAIPEGSLVQMKMPVLTVQNTIPKFFWLVNFLETMFSAELWPAATAATIAFHYRVIGEKWAEITCDNKDHIPFQFHDFAARGNMGMYANRLTGLGHLTSFRGTDSVFALANVQSKYRVAVNMPNDGYLYGASIPATEHSVMCAGEMDNEIGTFDRLISEIYPEGFVSIVSDTWDYWKVITQFLPKLKDKIMSRNGKVVIRPDSGDPVDIICGIPSYDLREVDGKSYRRKDVSMNVGSADGWTVNKGAKPVTEWERKGTIECMWEIFGGNINEKGFKVLDSHIGLIYGDSITLERAEEIFRRLAMKGFASSNVVLGVGSYTYQYVTRDTFGWAIKATYVIVNGEGRAIQKDPKTDDGTKKSLKGLLRHEYKDGKWSVKDNVGRIDEQQSDLPTIFLNGEVVSLVSIDDIRQNVDRQVAEVVKSIL